MVRREGPSRPTQLPTCTNTNAPDLSAIRPPSPERRSCAPPRLARRSCLRSQHSLNLHTSEQKGSGGGGTLGRMPPPHVSPEPAACLSGTWRATRLSRLRPADTGSWLSFPSSVAGTMPPHPFGTAPSAFGGECVMGREQRDSYLLVMGRGQSEEPGALSFVFDRCGR